MDAPLFRMHSIISLLFLSIPDFGYQTLVVTVNRKVLTTLPRENALRAHIIQFASLYIFGLSYQTDGNNGQLSSEKTRNFFDLLTIFFWNIPIKYMRKGSKKPKIKIVGKKVQDLWNNISTI